MADNDIQSLFLSHDKLGTYSCLTLDEAPTGPGLYAWYAQLRVGQRDWKVALQDGRDSGELACRRLLKRHTARFAGQRLSIAAQGAFSAHWAGELHDRTLDEIALALGADEGPTVGEPEPPATSTTPKLEDTLASEPMRSALLRALQLATPILAAPLYIGVATNLRTRLGQHKDYLFRLANEAAKRPELVEELARQRRLPNFASRATAAGLGPDSLVVYTLDLQSVLGSAGETDLRAVAEAAEWLLNRWHRPPFGVR